MIEIPAGKFYGSTDPYDPNMKKLSEFIFDPANKPLKDAFEKAAGVTLNRRGSDIHFFADRREDVLPISEALQALGKEVKLSVEKEKFDGILKKFGA